jgi:hypothetical protein
MKKNKYIKPASYILPSPLLLQAAPLSNQNIGDPDNPPVPIGGKGDEDDECDAKQRYGELDGFNSIPNSLW